MDQIESDSDDGKAPETQHDPEVLERVRADMVALKNEGNTFFSAQDYASALTKYSVSVTSESTFEGVLLPWPSFIRMPSSTANNLIFHRIVLFSQIVVLHT